MWTVVTFPAADRNGSLELDDRLRRRALTKQGKADQAVVRTIVRVGYPHSAFFELEQSPPVLGDFFAHRLRDGLLRFHKGLHHKP